jgi:hypothetical protein
LRKARASVHRGHDRIDGARPDEDRRRTGRLTGGLVGRESTEDLEVAGIAGIAQLLEPAPRLSELEVAQQVEHRVVEQRGAEELRALRHDRPAERARDAAAAEHQAARVGVPAIDQPVGDGEGVVDGVLPVAAPTGLVPRLALLAPAPDAGDGEDAPCSRNHSASQGWYQRKLFQPKAP